MWLVGMLVQAHCCYKPRLLYLDVTTCFCIEVGMYEMYLLWTTGVL